MRPELIELRLTTLKKLRDCKADDRNNLVGICLNYQEFSNFQDPESNGWMQPIFKRWPKYSNSRDAPVPATLRYRTCHTQYRYCENMWSKTSKYGKLRYELLDFMISELEKMICLQNPE